MTGKKERKKIQKLEYLENEKSFLDEKQFSYFLKGYHLVKNKNLIKKADTSFKFFKTLKFFLDTLLIKTVIYSTSSSIKRISVLRLPMHF